MKNSIEVKAATVEQAIEEGLKELDASLENVEVDILAKGGLLQKAVIKMTRRETIAQKAELLVNKILSHMNIKSTAQAEERDDCVFVTISGEDSAAAIGYRGEVLDAVQYLALTVLNENEHKFKKIVVDCENYRAKREKTLEDLANRLAEKAVAAAKKVKLEPMNPYERRIIHSALQDSEAVTTESEGEEPNRYVVIIPKGVEILGTYDAGNRDFKSDKGARSGRSDGRRGGGFGGKSGGRGKDGHGRGGRGRGERPQKPRDSYDDYDDIAPVEKSDGTPQNIEPLKRNQPLKIKSFGTKKFPY